MTQYYCFEFTCEGVDSGGYPFVLVREYIHHTEEEARRELVHALNHLCHLYPRKLKLRQVDEWFPSPFDFT